MAVIGELLLRAGLELSGLERDITRLQTMISAIPNQLQDQKVAIDLVPRDAIEQGRRVADSLTAGIVQNRSQITNAIGQAVADAGDAVGSAMAQASANMSASMVPEAAAAGAEAGTALSSSLTSNISAGMTRAGDMAGPMLGEALVRAAEGASEQASAALDGIGAGAFGEITAEARVFQTSMMEVLDQIEGLPLFVGEAAGGMRDMSKAASEAAASIGAASTAMEELEANTPKPETTVAPIYWDQWAEEVRAASAAADELAAAQARLTDAANAAPAQMAEDPAIRAERERLEMLEYTAQREAEIRQSNLARERADARRSVEIARQSMIERVQIAERTLSVDDAAVREAVFRGMLGPKEAEEAARINAEAYNKTILAVLDDARTSEAAGIPVFQGKAGEEAFARVAGSLQEIDGASRRSVVGLGRLNNAMVTVARQAAGAHPVVGQLVDVVGTFALGTGVMVGVLAGLAGLAAMWKNVTKEAREAKEEAAEVGKRLEEIVRVRDLGIGGQILADLKFRRDELDQIADRMADIQAELARGARAQLDENTGILQALVEQARMRRELGKLTDEQIDKEKELTSAIAAQNDAVYAGMADLLRASQTQLNLAPLDGVDRALAEVENRATERRIQAARTLTGDLLDQQYIVIEITRQREREAAMIEHSRRATEETTRSMSAMADVMRDVAVLQPLGLLSLSDLPEHLRESISVVDQLRARIEEIGRVIAAVRGSGGIVPEEAVAEIERLRNALARAESDLGQRMERIKEQWEGLKTFEVDFVPHITSGPGDVGLDSATIAAELQREYDLAMARLRLEAARGVVDEASFEEQGREAAEALNRGLVTEVERLLSSDDWQFRAQGIELAAKLNIDLDVSDDARSEAMRAAKEATERFNENISATNEVMSSFGDLAKTADILGESFAQAISGIDKFLAGVARLNFGRELSERLSAPGTTTSTPFGFGFGAGFRPSETQPSATGASESALLGKLAEVSGVLMVAAGAFQVASSFFGESAHERAIRENSAALREVRRSLDGLDFSTDSGAQRLAVPVDRIIELGGPNISGVTSPGVVSHRMTEWYREIDGILGPLGLTFGDLRDIAAGWGIALDGSTEAWEQLRERIDMAAEALVGFRANLLSDVQQERDLRDRIMGVERDPQQQLSALLGDLAQVAPSLFREYIGGVDLGSTDAIRNAILAMFEDFSLGGEEFAKMMGASNLSRDDFLSWVGQAADSMSAMTRAVDEAVGALLNVPQGFRILNVELARFNAAQSQRAEDMLPPPPPPAVPNTPTAPSGQNRRPEDDRTQSGAGRDRPTIPNTVTQNIEFNITPVSGESPESFARRVEEVLRRLNREAGLTYANDPYAYGPG